MDIPQVELDNTWRETREWGAVKKAGLEYLVKVGAIANIDNDYILTLSGLRDFSTREILDCLNKGIIPNSIPQNRPNLRNQTDYTAMFADM